ncbi:hypothetical protein ECHLIB_0548 [Ehrlichia chaffeensis str. Liberty]|nr:pentapeptide repeat-containing protein [Ehrlichia chaffeensis]AHX06601.1 hypothetical protein ECHLIB_0548 [Ehrlichia chaffeensis str. Liberty]
MLIKDTNLNNTNLHKVRMSDATLIGVNLIIVIMKAYVLSYKL